MSDAKHIGELDVGETAVLRDMNLPESAAERLMELGLLPGASIRLVRRAPLGCP
ncbi:MAG: ferrous iron transport protein A, partial [Verrucomicrobiales bacterium]|nr:ferrous iron transport protein A [Verrucomicrobiales bacterium]